LHSQEKNKAFKEFIKRAASHKANKLPFVLYQLPNKDVVKGVFQENSDVNYTTSFTETGFVFSPFKANKAVLLVSNKVSETLYEPETTVNKDFLLTDTDAKTAHIDLINNAIEKIKNGVFEKIVLSRKLEVTTKKDEFQIFQELLNSYPNAFKYLWYHPNIGMWIGATPETLLKVKADSFTTTSLAGTLPVIDAQPAAWTAKEINEQQLVTDYIVSNLKEKVNSITAAPTTTVKAGKLWHLKSVITGTKSKETHLGQILEILHPTPAVCGIPKVIAQEYIMQNEGYDRAFYTGFLGELNYKKTARTNLFVNLRCMKFQNKKATLFVGGGITSDSNAEKEWKETQYKSRTMLNLL